MIKHIEGVNNTVCKNLISKDMSSNDKSRIWCFIPTRPGRSGKKGMNDKNYQEFIISIKRGDKPGYVGDVNYLLKECAKQSGQLSIYKKNDGELVFSEDKLFPPKYVRKYLYKLVQLTHMAWQTQYNIVKDIWFLASMHSDIKCYIEVF